MGWRRHRESPDERHERLRREQDAREQAAAVERARQTGREQRAQRRAPGDWYRRATTGAVLLVAGIAATVSFVHIEHLARVHGQTPLAAALLPVSIDGTVAAASMVMLRSARAGSGSPGLARFMLVLSVAATLACNVAYGLPYGVTGALISGWPAIAFIGSAEMAIGSARRTARRAAAAPVPVKRARKHTPPKAPRSRSTVTPEHAEEKFADVLATGQVPSLRQVKAELAVGTPRARELRTHLLTVNGST